MKKYFDNEVLLTELARLIGEGHTVTIPVRGNSMLPFLADGRDAVTLVRCRPADLHPGDVVMARSKDGKTVLHRLIRREADRLFLRGDGNVYQTETATPDEVWAIATEVIRKGKAYPVKGWVWRSYSWVWTRLGTFGRRCVLRCTRLMVNG